jgi:hypothetical protein
MATLLPTNLLSLFCCLFKLLYYQKEEEELLFDRHGVKTCRAKLGAATEGRTQAVVNPPPPLKTITQPTPHH